MPDIQEEISKREVAKLLYKNESTTTLIIWFSILSCVVIAGISVINPLYSSFVAIGVTLYFAYNLSVLNADMLRLKQKYDLKTRLSLFKAVSYLDEDVKRD